MQSFWQDAKYYFETDEIDILVVINDLFFACLWTLRQSKNFAYNYRS